MREGAPKMHGFLFLTFFGGKEKFFIDNIPEAA